QGAHVVFWVYMLRCSDGPYYVGQTDRLEARLAERMEGRVEGYTQSRRPVTLVWSDEFPTRADAIERERQLKGWTRAKKNALARGDWDALRGLAGGRGSTGSPRTQGVVTDTTGSS